MDDAFKIWIDRLTEGEVQKIVGSFAPSFLEIDEKELQFRSPVQANGQAYLADNHLVIHLTAGTTVTVPCAICNQMVETELQIDNFYHTEALSDIPDAVFDFSIPLRESLLIELPHYFECNKGHCPERAALMPYLKKQKQPSDTNIHFPFADL